MMVGCKIFRNSIAPDTSSTGELTLSVRFDFVLTLIGMEFVNVRQIVNPLQQGEHP